jgi:hypothetical protein
MRVLFAVLIITEMCFIAGPFISSGINRPEAARAWHEWRQNLSPETEQAWKAESARLSRMNMVADSVLVTLLVINSVGLFMVGRKAFRKSSSPP